MNCLFVLAAAALGASVVLASGDYDVSTAYAYHGRYDGIY